jgi:perosamine synthetase
MSLKFKKFIPFFLPFIGQEEIEGVIDTLKSGWLTTGPKVKEFEKGFASFVGTKYALATSSCTAALHLSLEVLGLKETDEVITSPMTFAATAEVIRYFKAKPVFADIQPDTMNIDPKKILAYLEITNISKVKAIIPIHFAGHPCDMDAIMEIAKKYNLKVIEDAAHGFPAKYRGKMIGTIGDTTCFSFYPNKNITTGEGGMITTKNRKWAEQIRIMSLHGISKDAWKRYMARGSWYYKIIAPGYKYNLTDIAAAIGLAQLKKTKLFLKRRNEIVFIYNKTLKEIPEIEIPPVKDDIEHSWHLYIIKLNLERLSIDRNKFIELLKQRGIICAVHYIPLHLHPYYRRLYGYKAKDYPIAYNTYKRIISLPLYPQMTNEDVEYVLSTIKDVIRQNKR